MAGRPEGDVFDQLVARQKELERGVHLTEKSVWPALLRRLRNIAKIRPAKSLEQLAHMTGMNSARTERFGTAFLGNLAVCVSCARVTGYRRANHVGMYFTGEKAGLVGGGAH